MELRRFLLRLMLWSLAAAAGIGVLAMLFFQQEVVWRIVGTAATTAVASAVMLSLSFAVEREKARPAGLLGMGAVVVEFLLSLSMIWDFYPTRGIISDSSFATLLTMFHVFATALPAMFFLRCMRIEYARIASITGLAFCGVEFVLLMIPTWVTFLNESKWFGTAGAVAGLAPIIVAVLIGIDVDEHWWKVVGLLAGIIGLGLCIHAVWRNTGGKPWPLFLPITLAAVVALANLSLLCSLAAGQRWVRIGTIAAAAITAIFLDILSFIDPWLSLGGEMLPRLTGAAGILTCCGSLALIVLDRINRRTPPPAEPHATKQVTLICPGCLKKHTLPSGDAQCPTCNLFIFTRFTEPRCANCGYLLYMLKSDRCPECGAPVRSAVVGAAPDEAPGAL